jgi:2-polyprenyl-3-methyl-5-hydroxy-6-metoxy-1,4-benzoquinol methylase
MSNSMNACESCKAELPAALAIRTGLAYYCCGFCGHCIKLSESGFDQDFKAAQSHYFAEETLLAADVPAAFDREILKQRQKHTRRVVGADSLIVEVGPGAGFFASWLKSEGHRLLLIEHSPVLAATLARRLGVEVAIEEFLPGQYDGRQADVFCSFHVIEHVIDPLSHVRAGFEAVKPGGVGLIATPNAASWEQRFFRRLSPNFDSAHLRVFSETSLKQICETAGWTVEAAFTPEYTGGWLRVISKAVRKLRREDEETTAGKYAAPSTRLEVFYALAATLSWPFRKSQAVLHAGNETFLILRRPPLEREIP